MGWGFDYITIEKMHTECKDYPNDIPDHDTFHSQSDDFITACKEFNEFERDNEMWDVDPEASFNNGKEYRCIIGCVNYDRF